ncbi:MAG: phenylphosphate carboxylase subunit gamma [Thermincola sp.]|nr:phenylphosphate carboxylase subunit gamma [Thermincola sp.]MDT3705004.1 phenylphosphate carboxylase subunit gamma [Thermincola sp.]
MCKYDVYVTNLNQLPEGQELQIQVRDLTPGTHKYSQKWVKCLVSPDAAAYPEKLMIRFGQGQPNDQPYSIKVIEEINKIPLKFL